MSSMFSQLLHWAPEGNSTFDVVCWGGCSFKPGALQRGWRLPQPPPAEILRRFRSRGGRGSAWMWSVGAQTSVAIAGGLLDGLDLFANVLRPFLFYYHKIIHWIIGNVPVVRFLPPPPGWSALHQTHSGSAASAVPSCVCN